LNRHRPRAGSAKLAVFAAAALVALCVLGPSVAAGDYGSPPAAPIASGPTVFIKDGKGGLRFVAPKTVVVGEDLTILNQTNPKKVGPHTFSLVTKGSIPKTPKAQQICFTKNHICKAIAQWHGVKGNGPVKVNPALAGAPGWDTLGSLTADGDSWFTGNKPGTSFTQAVTADTSAGPTRIYFMCAIHPFMHGSIEVLPAG
jgi:hypothetical protein